MALLISFLLTLVQSKTELKDGETIFIDSNALFGTERYFIFRTGSNITSDLTFSLTTYSDYSDPDMFIKVNSTPTFYDFDYESISWGSGSLVLSPSEQLSNSDYHILILCYTICRYGITVSHSSEVNLIQGVPISSELIEGHQAVYQFTTSNSTAKPLVISLIKTGKIDMFVGVGKNPSSDDTKDVKVKWDGSLEFKSKDFKEGTVFKIVLMAERNSSYTVLVKSSDVTATLVQAGVPMTGEVETGKIVYYKVAVLSPSDVLSVSLTVLSGDSDLYVRASGFPSLTNYNFSSAHVGGENLIITAADRQKIGLLTGDYFIGVYGLYHSSYILSVALSNTSFLLIHPGVPLNGAVNQSMFSYFYISYPQNDTNITIYLSVESGNPDLFVRPCEDVLTKCMISEDDLKSGKNYYSSQHISGSESIEIAHKAKKCSKKKGKSCQYIIGVYGRSFYSIFTLSLLTNNTDELVLQEGKPVHLTASEGTAKFFKFLVINESVSEVKFMLTPIYGDSDLYGSLNSPLSDYDMQKSSINIGLETDQIKWTKGVDSDSLTGIYHIMAYPSATCSYSIVAMTTIPEKNSTIQIYPGHPQKDTVYNYTGQEFRIYVFPVHYTPDTKQKITITVTPITGQFSLYVTNKITNIDWNNQVFYYNWESNSTSHKDLASTITIFPDDKDYTLDSTYAVLVLAEKYLSDKSATFVINFSIGDGVVLLPEDVPYTGVVLKNEFSYFMFPIHFSHEDVKISVVSLSGDADVYISVNPENTQPNLTNYNFLSSNFGDEIFTLNWEESLKPVCPGIPENYSFGEPAHCFMYIGVYGFESTTSFIIRIHPGKGIPILLTPGQPTTGNITESEYTYYYAYIGTKTSTKISLQPNSGRPELFLNLFDKTKVSPNINDWTRPNKNKFDLSSSSTLLTEEIDLAPNQLNATCPSGTCLIVAGVYCLSGNCTFLVSSGKKNEAKTLIENQVTYATSESDFVYFSYYCAKDFDNFLVQVTPLSDGNPLIYISKGKEKFPNETFYDWKSENWGGSVLITKEDLYFNSSSMKGTYVIGVKDLYGNCSFTILVNNHPVPIQKLVSGVPQNGNLSFSSIAYYKFTNNAIQDLEIGLTPITGSGKIYVNTYYDWDRDIYASLPGPDKFIWSSNSSENKYRIIIKFTNANFCYFCQYLIAVYSNPEMSYSLTAKNILESSLLQDGVPIKSTAWKGQRAIYSFTVGKTTDIYLSLTPYTGNPNIYVAKSKELSWSNFIWSKFYVSGTINMLIYKNDTNFFIGTYYIIVEAKTDESFFTLLVHTTDNSVSLVESWPIFYTLSPPESINFKFTATQGHLVHCTVKSYSGVPPFIYTKFQSSSDKPSKASNVSFDSQYFSSNYTEIHSYNNNNISYLSFSNFHKGANDQLNIAVYSSLSESHFEIQCSGSTESSILKIDSFDIGILDSDIKSKQYQLITPEKGQLDVYVMPCLGDFSLEISSNWTVISQDTPDIVTGNMVDGIITGSVTRAQGSYFVTVNGKKLNSGISVYELFTLFTKKGDKANLPYHPGNKGLIQWRDLGDDLKIELSWSGLVDDSGLPVNETIGYRVYFSEQNEEKLLTACGILYHAALDEAESIGYTNNNSLIAEIPNKKGFVNILAFLNWDSPTPIKRIVYTPTEVSIAKPPSNKSTRLMFLLLFIMLFLAVFTSVYFYRKNKNSKSRLDFEMNDVRNLASVNQKPDKRSDPYSKI